MQPVKIALAALVLATGVAMADDAQSTGGPAADKAAQQPPAGRRSCWDMPEAEAKPAPAPDPLAAADPWEVVFKLYSWIPNYHGSAGGRGRTATVNVSCNDVLHALDEINCMVPVNLEGRWGSFGMMADLFYARLTDSSRRGPIQTDIESVQSILDLAAFYRVGTWPLCPGGRSNFTLDVLGGARYNRLQGTVGLTGLEHAVTLGQAQDWWDPLVGARAIWQATDCLRFSVRGDVGGFGLENCSHLAWQIIAAAELDITKNCFIELGYRLYDVDYTRGTGPSRFTYDVTMAGPYLAFGVKF